MSPTGSAAVRTGTARPYAPRGGGFTKRRPIDFGLVATCLCRRA